GRRPEFAAVNAVVGSEEQRAVDVREVAGGRGSAAGLDVRDQLGAGCGAVARPQLPAVRPVVGREVQRAVNVRQGGGVSAVGVVVSAARGGVDVRVHHGAAGGGGLAALLGDRHAIGFPQLLAVNAVVGSEVQCPVHIGQVAGIGAVGAEVLVGTVAEGPRDTVEARPRVEVLDHDGAGRGAVALP